MSKKPYISPRKSKQKTPRPVVIIVCDAKKTEPIYFSHFKNKKRDKLIDVKVVKSAAGKSYDAIIKKAIESAKGVEGKCTVWCVSDTDVNHNIPNAMDAKNKQLKKYVEDAKKHGFEIALSNPCFEFWFLLHFTYTAANLKDYNAVVNELVAYLPDYQKNSDVYDKLSNRQTTAIDNAKKLRRHYEEEQKTPNLWDVSVNPYTDVYRLVESLT
ncbi:MAG: RloB family protein [Defluviitaleaceae bacterium]|nr:RloB family protein [Defluviitaleaceae bacterium]